MFGEECGHAADGPRSGRGDVGGVLRRLEVVEIRRVVLRAGRRACDELCKLCRELYRRWCGEIQERQFVENVCQPLRFFLPVQVDAPQRVVQRLGAHVHLCRESLFGEVLECSGELEVFREGIFPVDAHHRLALLSVVGVAFERYVDRRPGVENALVEDGDLSGVVVNAVVAAFAEHHASCRDDDRTSRHVDSPEGDDVV